MTTASTTRRPALFFAAAFASILLLLVPALWNGFPLLEYDTGGYFARWYEGTLEVSRSTVYGLFLVLLSRPDFWPAVVVQSALTVWVIALVLRVHGLGGRPWALLGTVAVLSVGTTLPWITGILLTDIFAGLSVLALYLIVLRADALATSERVALLVLVAFSAAAHSATLAVLVGLLAVGLVVFLIKRTLVPIAGLARGVVAILLGAAMLLAANYAVAGRLAWTPGGVALSFGRMLQDGIVARFLAEHCPDPRLRLCDHRAQLPTDADTFFWGESIFDQLGRFDGMGEEMRTIVLDSVAAYPLWQLEAAASASGRQLLKVATGEGVLDSVWHTHGMIENFLPSALPAMRAAHQQKGEIDFRAINRLHLSVAFASMVLLIAVIVLTLRGAAFADLAPLAITVALAIVGNAVVCGVFANPHDRYGARMVWLATLVVVVMICRLAVRASVSPERGAISAG
jgi:hypothetical protein